MADELTIRAHLINEVSGPAQQARRDVAELATTTRAANTTQAAAGAAARSHSRDVQQLHQKVLGLSRDLGGQFATGLKLATIGIGGLGAAATFFGLKAASSFQTTRVAFDTMLGSVEAGGQLFKQLQTLNLKSPFELSQLSQATQVLLRYNVAADQVVAITQGIANAAALSGPRMVENLDRMSLALGQVAAKGKLQGEEARQLAEAGINAYGVYQRQLGLTREQVEKLGEAGKLPANILLDAVAKGELGIAGLNTAAEKMSQTLAGQFSNIKDLLSVGLADAALPLTKQLGSLIGTPDAPGALVTGLQALITNVGPPLFTLVGDLATLLSKALPVLGPLLTSVVAGVGTLLDAASPALMALQPVAGALGDSLGRLVIALVPVMPDLVRAFVALVDVLPAFVDLLADLVPLVAPILRLFAGFIELEPVRHGLAIVLGALLGYRAISAIVGTLHAFAGGLSAINAAQAAGSRTTPGPVGGGNAGKVARGAAGTSLAIMGAPGAGKDPVSTAAFIGGAALAGSAFGPWGTVIAGGGASVYSLWKALGDTPSPRSSSAGKNLANTLDAHRFATAMSGGGQRISNVGVGAYPGSDHHAGRALDVVGANLLEYANVVRAAGGYADFHGSHLHAVMGDTPSPRSTSSSSSSRDRAGTLVDIHDNTFASTVDLQTAIERGIAKERRDRKERD